ncbi:MAG: tetratricopeptide repeat protein [Bacteroidetes bacterium]|nr:tetratricopeptide repeat protein [Bacteroidota bacterium]
MPLQKKRKTILEDPEVLQEQFGKTEDFLKKNQNIIMAIGVAIVVIVGGLWLYRSSIKEQNIEAQAEMFQAVYYFEADSLNKALNGDGNNLGFLDIADEYSMTDAGNLASFYTGVIYLKQGQYEDAISYLEDFSTPDLLVQARAYSLIGDGYMELDELEEAIKYYNKAANYKPNQYFTPQYLMKLAMAYEAISDYASAVLTYEKIMDEFSESPEINDVKKYKARAEGLAMMK